MEREDGGKVPHLVNTTHEGLPGCQHWDAGVVPGRRRRVGAALHGFYLETAAILQGRLPGTPWGLHRVEQKIGDGEPEGMVFRSREPTGKCFFEYDEATNQENLITTRILRLRGMEGGVNVGGDCDSWNRYIYIHGTNHEDRIGTPASSGCVQLTNTDMLELFNIVPEESLVLIEKE